MKLEQRKRLEFKGKSIADWAILLFGSLGLILMILAGVVGMDHLGPLPLDTNYIAVGLLVMYTFFSGFKLYTTGNRQTGLYMMLFSALIVIVAVVVLRVQVAF